MRPLEHTRRVKRLGPLTWFSVALAGFIAVILLIFWLFLADYQRSLPKNLADQIFGAYQTQDVKTIRKYCANLPAQLQDPAQFSHYYTAFTQLDGLYCYAGASTDPTRLCYEYASGSDRIATLTLAQTGEKSAFGFPQYEIDSLRAYPLAEYVITAPADALLFADGLLLSERYREEDTNDAPGGQNEPPPEATPPSAADHFAGLLKDAPIPPANQPVKTYRITDFRVLTEVAAFGANGQPYTVTWSKDGLTATAESSLSADTQQEITAFAVAFSEAYSVFATKQNGPRDPVLRLLYPGTPFQRALLFYGNEWGDAFVSDRYENRVIDHFVQYSPTEFSCDIRFNYIITFWDGFEKSYPYSMTYYLTNRTGTMLLVDMQNR